MSDPALQALLDEVHPSPGARVATKPQPIAKVNYTHDGMINLIIADPGISQNAIAAHFGYSAAWVSRIMASDAWQARLAERTAELTDPTIRSTVEIRFKALLLRSMELLAEKLDDSDVGSQVILRTMEVSSRALGYGARIDQPAAPQQNFHLHLETMGERLTGLLIRKKQEAIEVTAEPHP